MSKPDVLAIVGGIIAFFSLALPWWTVAFSWRDWMGVFSSETYVSVYLFQSKAGLSGYYSSPPQSNVNLWFGWVALGLVVVGGLMSIMFGLRQQKEKVFAGGLIVLASLGIFAIGLQSALLEAPVDPWSISVPWLFSTATVHLGSTSPLLTITYTAYLTYGFWIALVAAVVMLVASTRYPPSNVEHVSCSHDGRLSTKSRHLRNPDYLKTR